MVIYIGCVLSYGKTRQQHDQHLQRVLQISKASKGSSKGSAAFENAAIDIAGTLYLKKGVKIATCCMRYVKMAWFFGLLEKMYIDTSLNFMELQNAFKHLHLDEAAETLTLQSSPWRLGGADLRTFGWNHKILSKMSFQQTIVRSTVEKSSLNLKIASRKSVWQIS